MPDPIHQPGDTPPPASRIDQLDVCDHCSFKRCAPLLGIRFVPGREVGGKNVVHEQRLYPRRRPTRTLLVRAVSAARAPLAARKRDWGGLAPDARAVVKAGARTGRARASSGLHKSYSDHQVFPRWIDFRWIVLTPSGRVRHQPVDLLPLDVDLPLLALDLRKQQDRQLLVSDVLRRRGSRCKRPIG